MLRSFFIAVLQFGSTRCLAYPAIPSRQQVVPAALPVHAATAAAHTPTRKASKRNPALRARRHGARVIIHAAGSCIGVLVELEGGRLNAASIACLRVHPKYCQSTRDSCVV